MKMKYKVEGVEVKIPGADVDVKVGKLAYGLDDVTPQELADAGVSLIKGVFGLVQSMFPDEFPFSAFDSGNAGHTIVFESGDYVTEDNYAGTVVTVDEAEGTVTYIIQEVANKNDLNLIGQSTIAYADNLSYVDKGVVSDNATYTVQMAPATSFPTDIDENADLPFSVGPRQDELNEASDLNAGIANIVTFEEMERQKQEDVAVAKS